MLGVRLGEQQKEEKQKSVKEFADGELVEASLVSAEYYDDMYKQKTFFT